MQNFTKHLASGVLALALSAGAASAATIVANGSFENVAGFSFNNNGWGIGSLAGWTSTPGGIEVQTQPTLGLTPAEGSYYVELDGNNNYDLFQNVALTAGRYALSFAYSPRVPNGAATNVMDFSVGSLLTGSVTGPGMNGTTVGNWKDFTTEFTVTAGGIYQLKFSGAGENDSLGALLDNVAMVAVPLPAAGLLLFGALGGLAVWRRRKTV